MVAFPPWTGPCRRGEKPGPAPEDFPGGGEGFILEKSQRKGEA